METRRIGILLSGVTGRMGTNQHLIRSIGGIIQQGGVQVSPDLVLMPDPLLIGRNEHKLQALAETQGPAVIGKPYPYTTDLPGALDGKYGDYEVFFDASGTLQRSSFIELAAAAGKHIYCEKPIATTTAEAIRLAKIAEKAGVKNGVVQDKLWLPSFQKIAQLKENGFFGNLLSVHGEFGYWVFTGMDPEQPPQRPSWNYRAEDGGGIMMDMFCHWQYVIENLFGPIRSVMAHGNIDIPERRDEQGNIYPCTADDSAYALFLLEDGTVCQFNSSWCVRVRRDDLLTVEVHGTNGSAVAGLRDVQIQSAAKTPRPVWNPDIRQPINFYDSWQQVPDEQEYDNAFKIQWELFLRHVALDEPFRWTLREGAKGVQLAELGIQSWKERRWVDVSEIR
jgi:predicted dehydrogenase